MALESYDWPGNVRELRNVVERTIIMAPGDRIGRIDLDLLPQEVLGTSEAGPGASAIMGALREARERNVRTRISARPNPPLLREHPAGPRASSDRGDRRCTGS
ncbi:hypothetical protein AB5I41_05280 [Sphingomonas sp. MMS24-JH45]